VIIQDLIGNAARRQVTGMQSHRYIDVVLPVYMSSPPLLLSKPENLCRFAVVTSSAVSDYGASDITCRKTM